MKASRGAAAKARPRIDSEEEQRKICSINHGVGASMLLLYPEVLGEVACGFDDYDEVSEDV